jgi:hypothetical protein
VSAMRARCATYLTSISTAAMPKIKVPSPKLKAQSREGFGIPAPNSALDHNQPWPNVIR